MLSEFLSSNHAAFDAAIVDLDGTMVDTMGDFVEAITRMLLELPIDEASKLPLSSTVVEHMVGKGSEHLIRSVLNHLASQKKPVLTSLDAKALCSELLFNTAFSSYQKHYSQINGQFSMVYPGVLDGLEGLHKSGLKLACLTNKPLAFAQTLLKIKKLDGFFTHVFGGDSFESKKPDPLPLIKTCEALGALPARTLMIGDSSNDALAARAAGCPVVLVTYGYNHGEPIGNVDADGFVNSLATLQF